MNSRSLEAGTRNLSYRYKWIALIVSSVEAVVRDLSAGLVLGHRVHRRVAP